MSEKKSIGVRRQAAADELVMCRAATMETLARVLERSNHPPLAESAAQEWKLAALEWIRRFPEFVAGGAPGPQPPPEYSGLTAVVRAVVAQNQIAGPDRWECWECWSLTPVAHEPSKYCRGGRRPHCTCDACW